MRAPSLPPHDAAQAGSSAVEFALVLTLMISLLSVALDVGMAFWYYDALLKGTRDAARFLSAADKATIASVGVPAAKQQLVDAATAAGLPSVTAANVQVTCLDSALADASCADGTAPGGVRVKIAGYTFVTGRYVPFVIAGAPTVFTLAPSATMRYIR